MDYLKEVGKHLDLSPADKEEVIKELTDHYMELKEELTTSGLDNKQIDEEASRRLGIPREIAGRLCAVHCSASWKTALMCAVPFVVSMITWMLVASKLWTAGIVIAILAGLVFTTMSAREFLNDHRPVWLATWWAGSLSIALGILSKIVYGYIWNGYYVFVTGICILAFIKAWRMRQHILITTLLSITCICLSLCIIRIMPIHGRMSISLGIQITILLAPIIYAVLLVFYSRLIFQYHRFGSGTQASLFMFSLTSLPYTAYSSTHNDAITYLIIVICQIICVISAVCYVRLPQRKFKTMALLAGIACLIIRNLRGLFILHVPLADIMVYTAIVTINNLFILIPILSERMKRPNRRQLA